MKTFITAALAVSLSACVGIPSSPSLIGLQDSVVRLDMPGGATCSGWVTPDHKIKTAAHCFHYDPTGQAVVSFNDGQTGYFVVESIQTNPNELKEDHATLVYDSSRYPIKYPKGLVTCPHKPYYGESVVLMGSPLRDNQIMFFGSIANPDVEDIGIAIDVKILPGNSEGPVIDRQEGCVIGSAELIHKAVPDDDIPYGVNYAAPVDNF